MPLPPARSRAGLVTACQQLLALGVVLAVLTPAAGVLTLDVVRDTPASVGGGPLGADVPGTGPAPTPAVATGTAGRTTRPASVPDGAVDAEVADYQLTAPSGARVAPDGLDARTVTRPGATEVLSEVLPVEDFGTVGVTWGDDARLEHDAVGVRYRTGGGGWSGWTEAEVEDDHAPDPGSAEAAGALRPGTDAVVVGDVDEVQVRVRAEQVPADLRAVVIEPGEASSSTRELPAIDTAEQADGGAAALSLASATDAPRPTIFSRAQWGANESLRDGSPSYGEVKAGFVHHTVNANAYDRDDVPGLLRSIYAYHTQSRGWSDIGYNFLVDRFGRIWEGRYGGVTRAVIGAHTLGYNQYAFAMSAIGNFDVAQPPQAMVDAYGALFAWKLGIHGVDAGSMSQRLGSRTFPAINGHRDAGSTACPGRYLYAKLGEIRRTANAAQESDPEPEPEPEPEPAPLDSDLLGSRYPDVVLRDAGDRAVVVPTGGLTDFGPARRVAGSWGAWAEIALADDLTGDGRADLLLRDARGATAVSAGAGKGAFGTPRRLADGPGTGHDLVVAVGDADGDGAGDLVARRVGTSRLVTFLGDGRGGYAEQRLGLGWARFERLVAPGDVTGDDVPDLLGQDGDGSLWLRAGLGGDGEADYAKPVAVAGTFSLEDRITGAGDLDRDGNADLLVRRAADGATVVARGRGDGTFGPGVGRLARIRGGQGLSGGADVGGTRQPDLVLRRGAKLVWLANQGTTETLPAVRTGVDLRGTQVVLNAGDWDGDGHGDLITRSGGELALHRGDGTGAFADPLALRSGFRKVRALQAVGDVTGDGLADLTGRRGGVLRVYPGAGADGIGAGVTDGVPEDPRDEVDATDWTSLAQVSDLRGAGRPDLVATDADGALWLLPVTGKGVGEPRLLAEGTEPAVRLR